MLTVLLLADLAHAADYRAGGKATVSEVSELVLYAPPVSRDDGWYVQAALGEKPVLLRLGTSARDVDGRPLRLTMGAAKKLGLKVSGKEGKESAPFKDLLLGSARLSGVASVGAIGQSSDVDGVINIAAFPDLAWAVEPGAGKVRVGPSGAGSVAEAVGAGVVFAQSGKTKHKVGTDDKDMRAGTLLLGEVTVSGVSMPASVALDGNMRVANEVDGGAEWYKVGGVENPTWPLPAVEGVRAGETEVEWREVGLLGQKSWVRVMRTGSPMTYRFSPPATVGFWALAGFDLGIDAGLTTIALRPHAGAVRASYVDLREAELRKPLEAPADPAADPTAANRALAGALAPLVTFLTQTGQVGEALEAGKRLAEVAPERCSSWHAYGHAQGLAGDYAAAASSFRKAGELYQVWAVRPLEERTRLAASEDKRSARADFDGAWSQPHSCFTAWSDLAAALVADGKAAAVAELYPKYSDLDATLPRVAGNAYLILGKPAEAEAAFRQAVQLSYNQDGFARGGMMLATAPRSRELALAQFEGNPDEEHGTLRYWLAYGELLRAGGGTTAVDGLKARVSHDPPNVPALLALANEQGAAGVDASATLVAAGERLASLVKVSDEPSVQGWVAEHHRLSGRFAEAAAAAEKAIAGDPRNPFGYFVRARVAQSAGDAPRAAEFYRKAGQVGAADPLYATLLSAR